MKRSNYHRPITGYNIYVESSKRGIRVVERVGFNKRVITDCPNDMHINAFARWVEMLFRKLSIKVNT